MMTFRTDSLRMTVVGGFEITYDLDVLEPRPWTAIQGEWAAELAEQLSAGPLLEVCSGAGHIGLIAAQRSGRSLVQVDADPKACVYARANAAAADLAHRVDVRCGSIGDVAASGERFPLVIADPPYIATSAVSTFPNDPVLAIDGGPDGLDVARACIDACRAVLAEDGLALLQLGSASQIVRISEYAAPGLQLIDQRTAGPTRYVALFGRVRNATR